MIYILEQRLKVRGADEMQPNRSTRGARRARGGGGAWLLLLLLLLLLLRCACAERTQLMTLINPLSPTHLPTHPRTQQAQAVPPARAARVLRDVAAALLGARFVRGHLAAPQDAWSLAGARAVFERVAHASIMRLSDDSMDKLFDLMAMAAKHQLLCATTHAELLQTTLRHLKGIGDAVGATAADGGGGGGSSFSGSGDGGGSSSSGAAACGAAIARAEALVRAFYARASDADLALMRHTLLRLLQGARVRVSLLMAEGLQTEAGRFALPACHCPALGGVRAFDPATGRVASERRHALAVERIGAGAFFRHPLPLGANLYAHCSARRPGGGSPSSPPPSSPLPGAPPSSKAAAASPLPPPSGDDGCNCETDATDPAALEGDGATLHELDVFAGLLRRPAGAPAAAAGAVAAAAGQRGGSGGDDGFRLQLLFADDDECGGGGGGGFSVGSTCAPSPPPPAPASAATAAAPPRARRELELSGANAAYRRAAARAGLDLLDGDGGDGQRGGGGDLLDLLEAAGE